MFKNKKKKLGKVFEIFRNPPSMGNFPTFFLNPSLSQIDDFNLNSEYKLNSNTSVRNGQRSQVERYITQLKSKTTVKATYNRSNFFDRALLTGYGYGY